MRRPSLIHDGCCKHMLLFRRKILSKKSFYNKIKNSEHISIISVHSSRTPAGRLFSLVVEFLIIQQNKERREKEKEETSSRLSPISIVSLFYSHFPNSGLGMENGTSSGDRLGEGSNCKLWSSTWHYHHIFLIVLIWSVFQRWWVAY